MRRETLTNNNDYQLSLFEEEKSTDDTDIQKTLDNINEKFGKSLIAPASIKLITNNKKERERLEKN